MKHDLVKSVMEVRRECPRIISLNIVVNEKVVAVISVYASQSGRSDEQKEKFYEDLTAEVRNGHFRIPNPEGSESQTIQNPN